MIWRSRKAWLCCCALAADQVAVDRILGSGRQPFSVLRSLLAQEVATVTAALDQLSSDKPDLPSLLGVTAGACPAACVRV